jgi:glycosyltransferase involved in cell wall biosynthesis
MNPPRVLIFTDYYQPGYRAGGPVRSLANLARQLGHEFLFRIVTRDRDLGDDAPYNSVPLRSCTLVDGTGVVYIPAREMTPGWAAQLIKREQPSAVYLNSFFSRRFSLVPRLGHRLSGAPIQTVLAPRGEFAAGALSLRPRRKRAYIAALRAAGLLNGMIWHASAEHEANDIREVIGDGARILIAPDLVSLAPRPARSSRKQAGSARFVHLARIAPVKNLLGTIRLMGRTSGEVTLCVYGPIESDEYWKACLQEAARLPGHVRFDYGGPIEPDRTASVLAESDALVLLSLGENFGHVVPEALGAGCPAILSDRTPWRGLAARGVGWDLPIEDEARMLGALNAVVGMEEDAHAAMRDRARSCAESVVNDPAALAANRDLFQLAVSRG